MSNTKLFSSVGYVPGLKFMGDASELNDLNP